MTQDPNISPLEEQIKSVLSQHEATPPPGSWEAIEHQIPQVDPSFAVKVIEGIKSLGVLKASIGLAVLSGLIYGIVSVTQNDAVQEVHPTLEQIEEFNKDQNDLVVDQAIIVDEGEKTKPSENEITNNGFENDGGDAKTNADLGTASNSIQNSDNHSSGTDHSSNQNLPEQANQESSIAPDDTSVCEGQKVPFHFMANSETQITGWYINGSRVSTRKKSIWVVASNDVQQVEVEYVYNGEIFRKRSSLKPVVMPTELNQETVKDGFVTLSPIGNNIERVNWKSENNRIVSQGNSIQQPVNQIVYAEVMIKNCTTTIKYLPEISSTLKTAEIFFIPNAFSPNGDGKNDRYLVSTKNVQSFYIEIRNGEGQKVFESTNPKEGWNGLEMNNGNTCRSGLYIGKIVAIGSDGIKVQKATQINLIRNN